MSFATSKTASALKIITVLPELFARYRSNRAGRFGLGAIATIALLALAIIMSMNFNGLPDMQPFDDADQRKAVFFSYLAPIVETRNSAIMLQREKLLRIADTYQREKTLSFFDEYQLKSLAQDYELEWNEVDPASVIATLKRRIDLVPDSLVLVQAAKESGWGTSRFAREGNNLFGHWCFSAGCGIVPENRAAGANHEVQVFDSVQDAIDAYLHNINTGDAYRSLRDIRARLRGAGKTPDGRSLADGLLLYSQRREAYVEEVQLMLDQYHQFEQDQSG